jgi:hypothetical protein
MNDGNPHDKEPPYPKPNGADSQFRVEIAPSGTMSRESWKIFQIMAEFVEGFERLTQIQPSVSIFGSARTPPGHPYYALRANFPTPDFPWSAAADRD